MKRFSMMSVVALCAVLGAVGTAGAINAAANFVQEATQSTTRANPTLATEGMPLSKTVKLANGSTLGQQAVTALQLTVSAAAGTWVDAGISFMPDAGVDEVNGGVFLAWRYSPLGGWVRVPSMDQAVTLNSDGGSYQLSTIAFPAQSITVAGPQDRFLYAGYGVTTVGSAATVAVTLEGTLSDRSAGITQGNAP